MKSLLFVLITLFASHVFAEQPVFTCLERTGFKYNFYLGAEPRIEKFDDNNQDFGIMTGFVMEYLSIETSPSIDSFSFKYPDGNEVAFIEFRADQRTGHGEMIDNDNTMICERTL